MKKTILSCVAMAGLASTSFAGVLLWKVNASPTIEDVNGQTPSSIVSTDFNNWNTAKIAKYDAAPTNSSNTGDPLTFYSSNDYTSKKEAPLTQVAKKDATTEQFALPVDSDSSYSSGLFYIELYNDKTLVGRSKEYLTYDSSIDGFRVNGGNDIFDGSLNFSDLKTWNGGATYVAVPEPTSGVMLLLGAALLGLRRRRV